MLSLAHPPLARLFRWWVWPLLAAMLAGAACKPRQKVCETARFYRVLEPPPDAGMPFSIDPMGPELKGYMLVEKPLSLVFQDDNRARLEWIYVDFAGDFPIAYSDEEGLARSSDGGMVFPMKRLTGIFFDRVHLGFQTTYCVGTEFYPCPEKEIYLVADMICRWEPLEQ